MGRPPYLRSMWHISSLADMPAPTWDALCRLRQEVFVVEQNCAFVDADGYDDKALHLWLERDGLPVAYARLLPPGVYYRETSIGRVVTKLQVRNTGLGVMLMDEVIRQVEGRWRGPIKIMAQTYLEPFYRRWGFVPEGNVFWEDDIPHRIMVRPG